MMLARDWSIRCYHEALEPPLGVRRESCFITFTYDPEHLPADHGVDPREMKRVLKELRRRADPRHKLRYFLVGEYGGVTYRPHYHMLLYGESFREDGVVYKVENGRQFWTNERLDAVWKKGVALIGELTPETAAYTAGYCLKKLKDKEEVLGRFDEKTGEAWTVHPTFRRMSLKPGLGSAFFAKYGNTDIVAHDQVVMPNGVAVPVPRYYDKLTEVVEPERMEEIKRERADKIAAQKEDRTPRRLREREDLALSAEKRRQKRL